MVSYKRLGKIRIVDHYERNSIMGNIICFRGEDGGKRKMGR